MEFCTNLLDKLWLHVDTVPNNASTLGQGALAQQTALARRQFTCGRFQMFIFSNHHALALIQLVSKYKNVTFNYF